ncbi:phage capsid protein [Ruminiclostridium cellulolyticum]|uniref:Putative phage minor capsid protein n=1 Tax=Ruminiclostridium cellulolyticum (strain ATCC 35319 / DSM 5812 / JCM 6584 / H10) TaxID=394503 RepID=B8I129_RUMCH|nr:phage capsid protein [Ruminiclostridium cellulolyticum]ACL77585.1 putative phage minor capsid protein [Ruminiclostridium cellulolyticum H10]
MGWIRDMVTKAAIKILKIQPALENRNITVREPFSFETNALRNRLWYRGEPSELEQFFKQTAFDSVSKGRFWAAVPSVGLGIRKIHSGLPSMIADRLSDIVIADLDGIELKNQAETDLWDEISKDNKANKLLGEAITETLVEGDGAFKITIDTDVSQYPLIEFYSGERVDYTYMRGRLQEVIFYTDYAVKAKEYRLAETYGKGYIRYKLFDSYGKEVALTMVPETAALKDITYTGDFIMAVPLMFFKSPKWQGRGKSLFDGGKSDDFDALDEVISQWIDAIRSGRVQKYIPEDLIPKNPNTGELLKPNAFDNQFIKIGSSLAEDAKTQISTVQPQIMFEAFVASYASILDVCLQGIISPSTLGIDLKKTDNAEAQREKEKATLYTRGKIIDALNEVIPQLVAIVLKVYDLMQEHTAGEYEASVAFGEYASPSFDTVVETVGKAKSYGIMSLERCVEELYGDTWTDEDKAKEVARLKSEQAPAFDEPSVAGQDGEIDGDGEV